MTRPLLRTLLALVLAAAAAGVGWHVLKPAELVITARHPLTSAWMPGPAIIGVADEAPLMVDGSYRVFAAKRQLRSDGPADDKFVSTSQWSLRRWPQQLSGVVSVGTTVISRWSDGKLIAQDATDGRVLWQVKGPAAPAYGGFRVGTQTVWAPEGLHTSGHFVVISTAKNLISYDSSTGSIAARVTLPSDCTEGFHSPARDGFSASAGFTPGTGFAASTGFIPSGGFTTAGGAYVCETGAYDVATGKPLTGWPAGNSAPLGCDVAASACQGLRDATGHGWLTGDATPTREPALDAAGSTVVGGRIYTALGALLDPATGAIIGSYPGMLALGATDDRIALLDQSRNLVQVDRDSGLELDRRPLAHLVDTLAWDPGMWQVSGNYVAVERLHPDGLADPGKPDHYYNTNTVILAAIG